MEKLLKHAIVLRSKIFMFVCFVTFLTTLSLPHLPHAYATPRAYNLFKCYMEINPNSDTK